MPKIRTVKNKTIKYSSVSVEQYVSNATSEAGDDSPDKE
jgi:hypothetical protein